MREEINNNQHENCIWTWKSNKKNGKASLYIPYLIEIRRVKKTYDNIYEIVYGISNKDHDFKILLIDLLRVDVIFFYSITDANLSLEFLNTLRKYNIVLILEEVNSSSPYVFFSYNFKSQNDVLSKQILFRANKKKRLHIARKLIESRIKNFNKSLREYPSDLLTLKDLKKAKTLQQIITIESKATRIYWTVFFRERLNLDLKRREDNRISAALNACSSFFRTILLRWVVFHKLSPFHAYLHLNCSYDSLIYDLMEPYRYLMEKAVLEAAVSYDGNISNYSIKLLKKLLNEVIYVPQTRQYIKRKALLHGIVLSLRTYLLENSKQFIVPIEGRKEGGRPLKVAFNMPGEIINFK